MKKIVMTAAIAIAAIGFTCAQETQQEQLNRINQIELPLSAQEDLLTGEYSDWNVVESFEIQEGAREDESAYQVIVSREGQVMKLFYDERGNLVRKEKDDE
jgi:hypothetical protein